MIVAGAEVILDWPEVIHANPAGYVAFLCLITFAFWCFLILKIGQGKNWARIVYLVLLVAGTLKTPSLVSEFDEHPVLTVMAVGGIAIQAFAMILVFSGSGKQWFLAIQKTH